MLRMGRASMIEEYDHSVTTLSDAMPVFHSIANQMDMVIEMLTAEPRIAIDQNALVMALQITRMMAAKANNDIGETLGAV